MFCVSYTLAKITSKSCHYNNAYFTRKQKFSVAPIWCFHLLYVLLLQNWICLPKCSLRIVVPFSHLSTQAFTFCLNFKESNITKPLRCFFKSVCRQMSGTFTSRTSRAQKRSKHFVKYQWFIKKSWANKSFRFWDGVSQDWACCVLYSGDVKLREWNCRQWVKSQFKSNKKNSVALKKALRSVYTVPFYVCVLEELFDAVGRLKEKFFFPPN